MSNSDAISVDADAFEGEITVASKIIDYISSGLYNTPAACLKELINNAYDADATNVSVFIKPDADRIIIDDDGCGMTRKSFVDHFARISESHKRDNGENTSNGRPKIGRIGIGFIAANELCEEMELFSTTVGSRELLHVRIDFAEMRRPPAERLRKETDYVKADYFGSILEADPDEHYTSIFLKSVRGEARNLLAGARPEGENRDKRSLYGLTSSRIAEELVKPSVSAWSDFDSYSENMLKVGLNVPVKYHENWLPGELETQVRDFEVATARLNFAVRYDGNDLRKPIVLGAAEKRKLLRRFDYKGEHVSAKGYFYVQHGTIKPKNLHGLLVRIRNAAVGEYDPDFWGFSASEASLIQRWVSAEIWADDRLEEAMNIDRRTLRIAHPAYVELQRAIHKDMRQVLAQSRKELYQEASNERKLEKSLETATAVRKLALDVAPISRIAAQRLSAAVDHSPPTPKTKAALQRTYTFTEVYDTIIDISKDVLSREQLAALLERLTERLQN